MGSLNFMHQNNTFIDNERNQTFKDIEYSLRFKFLLISFLCSVFHIIAWIFQKVLTQHNGLEKTTFIIIYGSEYTFYLIVFLYYFINLYYMMNKYHNFEFKKSKVMITAYCFLTMVICGQHIYFQTLYKSEKFHMWIDYDVAKKDKICESEEG